MVMDALNGVPASVPSSGVTSQVTTSPFANPEDKVALVPMMLPPFFQAKVLASVSPSGSE